MFVCHTYLPRHTHRVHTHALPLSLVLSLVRSLCLSLSNTHTHTHKDMLTLSLSSLFIHCQGKRRRRSEVGRTEIQRREKKTSCFPPGSVWLPERETQGSQQVMPLALRNRTSSGRFCFPLSMTMMRRDRFFLVFTLAAVFAADLYFILLPKLQRVGQRSVRPCSCSPDNITLPQHGGVATPQLSNWTSAQHRDGTGSEHVVTGSKLENLFSHALYSIQTPELAPEERLLATGQLMEYYKKKVARWERSVHHTSARLKII